ncbi:MAG: hypothetical protein MI924_04645 [Chloroflexales bacterium]|nr:hypothetical protein [Chloroflexales bacterium]
MVEIGEAKLPQKLLHTVAAAALPPLPRYEKEFLEGCRPPTLPADW